MKTVHLNLCEETKSIELAVGSFIISTVLFVFYMVSNESTDILVFASPFVVSVIILNAVMLFHLTDNFIKQHELRKNIACKILVVLANIPIAILYYIVVMKP